MRRRSMAAHIAMALSWYGFVCKLFVGCVSTIKWKPLIGMTWNIVAVLDNMSKPIDLGFKRSRFRDTRSSFQTPFISVELRHKRDCMDTRQNAELSGADLNGDNLRISRAYLRISDRCWLWLGLGLGLRLGIWLGLVLVLGLALGLLIVVYKLQTAGKSDKMRINHVIKTDQWRSARSAFCCVPTACG